MAQAMLQLYFRRLGSLTTARWTCTDAQRASQNVIVQHDAWWIMWASRDSNAGNSSIEQLTDENDVFFRLQRTFDPSLYFLYEVVCRHIL